MNSLIAPAATFVLGIGVVWAFLGKFLPTTKKYITIAKEALDLLDSVLKAVEDREVTQAEIEAIRVEANALLDALKK